MSHPFFGREFQFTQPDALDDLIASGLDLSDLSTDSRGYGYAVHVFYAGERHQQLGPRPVAAC